MRKNLFITAIAVMALTCSCEREQAIETERNDAAHTLFATLEKPEGSVLWAPSEEIMVFSGSQSGKFTSTNTEPSSAVTFQGDIDIKGGSDIWALYPYDEDATFANGLITTTVPSVQVACAGSFARNTNVTIAHSTDTNLEFYNVCGGVRFSVTEEGIKKVIFEGIDGEAIAGKVSVEFKDGLPAVQSITNASPFITLTAPEGDSFKVGEWYYISVLPGTLEGGYKIRFYKDETYAKRISDKSVSIQRSVFETIEEADKEKGYEQVVIQSPKTIADMRVSEAITNTICDNLCKALHCQNQDVTECDAQQVAGMAANIEDVVFTHADTSRNAVTIMQKDSVIVLLDLNAYDELEAGTNAGTNTRNTTAKIQKTKSLDILQSKNVTNGDSKKVLVAVPFDEGRGHVDFNFVISFASIGYSVDLAYGEDVTFKMLVGDNLTQYDVVVFITRFDEYLGHDLRFHASMETGEQEFPLDLPLIPDVSQYIRAVRCYLWEIKNYSSSLYYYAITDEYLKATTSSCYPNTIVYISGKDSAESELLIDYFASSGCSAFFGWQGFFPYKDDDKVALTYLAESLTKGADMIHTTSFLYDKVNASINHPTGRWGRFFYDKEFCPMWLNGGGFRIVDPRAYELKAFVDGRTVNLMWENNVTESGNVNYLYVNNIQYPTNTAKSAILTDMPEGQYNWYVQSDITSDGYLIESVRSEEKSFTIGNPGIVSVDLGLSVKWASCNLGASRPEEYGGHYQWAGLDDVTDWSFNPDIEDCPYHKHDRDATGWTKYIHSFDADIWGGTGDPDNKTVLDPEDDVAHVQLGGKWRMPTKAEFDELLDNCFTDWTTLNGVPGVEFKSKINGKSIFFPLAGWRQQIFYADREEQGSYWTSSLWDDDSMCAHKLSLCSECYDNPDYTLYEQVHMEYAFRWCGYSVRPVVALPKSRTVPN